MRTFKNTLVFLFAVCAIACGGSGFTEAPLAEVAPDSGQATDPPDTGSAVDTGVPGSESGTPLSDSGTPLSDTGTPLDSGSVDSGSQTDSDVADSGAPDSGFDAGTHDSGAPDSGLDSGAADASPPVDAGPCLLTMCNGACVDTNSDPNNCGACGYATANGRSCISGKPYPAWQSISNVNAPPARTRHAAAFAGGDFVVTGGAGSEFGLGTTDVGYYNPATNAWTPGQPLNQARCSHGSVSSILRVYVFGGLSDCSNGTTTGPGHESYNPGTGAWTAFTAPGQAALRYNFATTWIPSNQTMLVFGGSDATSSLYSGGVFKPLNADWGNATCLLAGCARSGWLGAFVDGNSVYVWGGNGYPNGLQYNYSTNVWSDWTLPASTPDPMPQRYADDGRRIYYLQSLGSCLAPVRILTFDRVTHSWGTPDSSGAPAGMVAEAATAWSGSEMITWSGACGSNAPTTIGGRYQPPAP